MTSVLGRILLLWYSDRSLSALQDALQIQNDELELSSGLYTHRQDMNASLSRIPKAMTLLNGVVSTFDTMFSQKVNP